MNSNRCPECGGIAGYYLTDMFGKVYRKCITGLTSFREDGSRDSYIRPCDTIIDDKGKKFTGTIAFDSNGKTRTLAVTAGKERR